MSLGYNKLLFKFLYILWYLCSTYLPYDGHKALAQFKILKKSLTRKMATEASRFGFFFSVQPLITLAMDDPLW